MQKYCVKMGQFKKEKKKKNPVPEAPTLARNEISNE